MSRVTASDVSLIRGSVDLTINGVVYSALNFKDAAKIREDKDYATNGKYIGTSGVEDREEMTVSIRARSNQVAPPKFFPFAFTVPNGTSTATTWFILERELSGSQSGVQSYDCTIVECPSGAVTVS
jgi:hypothetical protein